MSDQWYYEHELKKCGPVSSRQLRDFADAGVIGPTDTIWKEGIEKGVAAAKVKNLFATTPAAPQPASSSSSDAAQAGPVEAAPVAELPVPVNPGDPAPIAAAQEAASLANDSSEEATAAATEEAAAEQKKAATTPPKKQVKKARAVALRGLAITGQDGSHVQFKKKCVVCGHEDPNKMRIPIKNGINRISYFCGKCKKMRQAEFQGVL
jgi:hypothetical protein